MQHYLKILTHCALTDLLPISFCILPPPNLRIQHTLGGQRDITQLRRKHPHIKASMLHLLALVISRRHSPFLTPTFKAQEKTTTLAIQLAGVISKTPNSSLIDVLICIIIRTRPPLVIRIWDSHTAINRLLSDIFRLFESPTLDQTTCAPRWSPCLNGNNLINAF